VRRQSLLLLRLVEGRVRLRGGFVISEALHRRPRGGFGAGAATPGASAAGRLRAGSQVSLMHGTEYRESTGRVQREHVQGEYR
jgi:hypothetical protein